ncbi:hypothetical protein BC476_17570 [Vibrio parahaemolyticus]|nr:hypothetical protein BC476_17570 [Vibrio parahaemolyticus]
MECNWCKSSMDDQAVVCPTCNRERKDFHNLKYMMYALLSISMTFLGYGLFSGVWLSPFLGEFEIKYVFQSVSGWFCLLSFIGSQVLYIKASRIIKTWWWF